MPMTNKGLTKLCEELGELTQIAAKKISYMDTDEHPDGKGSMRERLAEEMGDVLAAVKFVAYKLEISEAKIGERAQKKFELFVKWDTE